jgi:hypothetical protein
MAAEATTPPVRAFRDAATGSELPAGNAVRYPKAAPEGTTAVRFNEYACAVFGILHEPDNNGK